MTKLSNFMILSDGAGAINQPNLQNKNWYSYDFFEQINGFTLGLSRVICNEVYFIKFQDGRRHSEVPNLKIEKRCIFQFFWVFSSLIDTIKSSKTKLSTFMILLDGAGVINQPNL